MTLRPYATASLTYDSNVGGWGARPQNAKDKDDFLFTISPSLWLHYNAETWSAILSGYYAYRQYFNSAHRNSNRHEYGEEFRWNWANSTGTEKGWSLILGESFRQITMANDMIVNGGAYNGDTRQFQLSAAVQRRFSECWHGDVNASYYWLDYLNDTRGRAAFYGWNRWTVGAEAGFAPSRWTDILVSGSYQGYDQDNLAGSGLSNSSRGETIQIGLGSYMTDRISYRLLGGWSRFEYAGGAKSSDGFVYTATGNWKIGETWNTMLLATSYYQPSERQYATETFVNAVSWGIAKVMVRGKLRTTLDIRYRREDHEYALRDAARDWDYALDIWTGRIGIDYTFCRFLSAFANAEYQKSINDKASHRGKMYDYDRWRVTIGLKLSY